MKILSVLLLCGVDIALSAIAQTPGTVDWMFQADQSFGWIPQAVQPDGKVLVSHILGTTLLPLGLALARLNPDGSYDGGFVPGHVLCSKSIPGDFSTAFVVPFVQADGRILIGMNLGKLRLAGGEFTDLVRLNSDGSVDDSFRYAGPPIEFPSFRIVQAQAGRIWAGSVRLQSDGSVDASFKPDLPSTCDGVAGFAAHGDAGILVTYGNCADTNAPAVVRLNFWDGKRDPVFHPVRMDGGLLFHRWGPSPLQPLCDGKILLVGNFSMVNGRPRAGLARLFGHGVLDEAFVPAIPDGWSAELALAQGDGKVIVFLVVRQGLDQPSRLVKLNADGSLDSSFSSDLVLTDIRDEFSSLLAPPDGSIWATVSRYSQGLELWRLHGDVPVIRLFAPIFDIDTYGRTRDIRCDGPCGRNVVLEVAHSLSPALWVPIVTNTFDGGGTIFIDQPPKDAQQRFYRAVLRRNEL